MREKLTKHAKRVYTTTRRIVDNAEHFVLAIALIICAGYNWYDLTIREVNDVEFYVRLTASVVIALKGGLEVIRFFNKETK